MPCWHCRAVRDHTLVVDRDDAQPRQPDSRRANRASVSAQWSDRPQGSRAAVRAALLRSGCSAIAGSCSGALDEMSRDKSKSKDRSTPSPVGRLGCRPVGSLGALSIPIGHGFGIAGPPVDGLWITSGFTLDVSQNVRSHLSRRPFRVPFLAQLVRFVSENGPF